MSMVNNQTLVQKHPGEKTVLEDLFEIKKRVDQMDLLEFKIQWDKHGKDYNRLEYADRLKFTVMSIKILDAKVDLVRTISSIKERSTHPEPKRALYYYLRANLWKFLDNFRYILLVDDISNQVKLDCIELLNELKDIIAQDEQLKDSCVFRLHKLLAHIRTFENDTMLQKFGIQADQVHSQLDQRVSQLIYALEPHVETKESLPTSPLPSDIEKLLQTYSSFSVSRISIEKSGVLSIIQLLHDHPLVDLEKHKTQLQKTLNTLVRQVINRTVVGQTRNQCAYALVILMEMVKMHKGLPVLLLKIFELCSYIQFSPPDVDIDKEIRGLKGKVMNVSQKKLRPIIEDVLWKKPEYLTQLAHLRTVYPWCYSLPPKNTLNINYIQRVVASSFDRLLSAQQSPLAQEESATTQLSKIVIEILGLLVNVEPSPHFLKVHAKETLLIKQAKESSSQRQLEKLLDKQYNTYRNHLKFLQDSIDYYQGILERLEAVPAGE